MTPLNCNPSGRPSLGRPMSKISAYDPKTLNGPSWRHPAQQRDTRPAVRQKSRRRTAPAHAMDRSATIGQFMRTTGRGRSSSRENWRGGRSAVFRGVAALRAEVNRSLFVGSAEPAFLLRLLPRHAVRQFAVRTAALHPRDLLDGLLDHVEHSNDADGYGPALTPPQARAALASPSPLGSVRLAAPWTACRRSAS